jgi:OOP family OmpA-OmpF porin
MRILITGSLVFLLWAIFSSWLFVTKIKPACTKPAETAIAADTAPIKPSPPPVVEIPKPETMILYFDYNKSSFKSSEQPEKQTVLFKEWMVKHPEALLQITGHTDSKGSDSYNQTLGMERAENTMKYLAGKGISPEKMKTASKGKSEPVSENTTEEGRSKNRRTEITLK